MIARRQIHIHTSLLAALLLWASSAVFPAETDQSIRLTLLHTNDHHGRFWPNQQGEYGMAARKTLVDRIRAEVAAQGGYTLLLSGGDVNTGVPESDMQNAEPDFKGMSQIGYDAMAVGNHEFDNPLEVIRQQQAWSSFDFLSANSYDSAGKRLFKPYKIFEKGGKRIAVVGLITHSTRYIGNPEHIKGLTFTLPEEEMRQLLPTLERRADLIIALTHMGHDIGSEGNDVTLARAVDGIDIIVGGHSQQPVCTDARGELIKEYHPGAPCKPDYENATWIMQAHEWGKYVGRADFVISSESVELVNYQLIPVNLKTPQSGKKAYVQTPIPADAGLQAMLRGFQKKGGASLSRVITHAQQTFTRAAQPDAPSPLGKLITQGFLRFAQGDIAITNSGGIRDNLYQGAVTVKSLMQVMPFGNTVSYVDLNGKALSEHLEAIGVLTGNRRRLQVSGMAIAEDGSLSVGDERQPLDPEKMYRLVTNSFLAAGGDGHPPLTNRPTYVDTGVKDFIAVEQLLAGRKSIGLEDF